MDLEAYYSDEFERHAALVPATQAALRAPFLRLVDICREALNKGGKIVFLGNGGSAADAQHLATELTIRFRRDRAPLAALALTTDTSTLTAAGNDFGFEDIFARQVEALCKPEDVVIGISTSGQSPNVIKALEAARRIGAVAAGLGGRDGGPMAAMADPCLVVPSDDTARIQEMHILLGHLLCGALEQKGDES